MCCLRHRLRIFLFRRKIVLFSRYSSFCIFNHPMIYQICDVTMSISTWGRLHFWIYLLNNNSWSHQTRPIGRYKQGQKFLEIFWSIWRTGDRFHALFNLATCSNYSITNNVELKWQLKMVNANHWEWPDLAILSF